MALFTRRSRSGWLDELDGIRGEALSLPDGEVATAMADAQPLPEVGVDRSPLTQFESPLAPARPLPAAIASPAAEAEVQPVPAPAAAAADADASLPAPSPNASRPAPPPNASLPAPPPPPPVASSLPPPTAASAADTADTPVAETEEQLPPPPASTQPAPHPIRPHEMWHPAVVVTPTPLPPPPAPVAEEHVDPAELVDAEPEAPSSRFRFARLRPVLPASEPAPAPAAPVDPAAEEQPPYSLIEELLAPYGVPPVEAEQGPVGHGSAPFVPAVTPVSGRTLINGPVNRRTQRDDEFVRRRDLNTTLPAERLAARPPVEPLDAPAAFAPTPPPVDEAPTIPAEAEPAADPVGSDIVLPGDVALLNDAAAEVDVATAPTARSLPVIGIQADGEVVPPAALRPAPPDPVAEPVAAEPVEPAGPTAADQLATEPTSVELTAAEPAVPEVAPAVVVPLVLAIGADRVVPLDGGHLRLADDVSAEIVEDADGVRLALDGGWCWTVLAAEAEAGPVVVTMPAGTLTVPAGATALAVVEADRTSFVVVVAGEASLAHPGGRMRLRPGAMALAPLGAEPQVDVASEDEIGADPLVARNRQLDAG